MSEFLTENNLNAALSHIFESAKYELLIISPYIKLHDRIKSILKSKLNNPDLSIVLLFGKNEDDISKSLNQDDFNFFKQFPNIQIRFEKRLHAKLYANEYEYLITSMNLYDYSQNINIESGIIGDVTEKRIGKQTLDYFNRVIEQSELIFEKVPVFETKMFGLSSKYLDSEIEIDNSDAFYSNKSYKKVFKKNQVKITYDNKNRNNIGYCIRTGIEIPFNIKKPLCDNAFKSWKRYENQDYAEKYCHFSGELSNGNTSVGKPILKENWNTAKKTHGF
ncbi:phospholipase D family protein [uncultured Psychroserpens sp.]|uniref:phospholipase D family protein n=1 Tax=uncultured Psychroserpens sp. TaxID=255436 RepID=UPI002627B297|nr:phospholipase D family protein [uncultured Psychroserpens sp.]